MSIVWPCPLTVDAYASMGRAVQVPRPDCPSCLVPAVFWSGYWRYIRWQGFTAEQTDRYIEAGPSRARRPR